MLEKKLGTLFLVTCLILTTIPAALGDSSASVVHVAGDGEAENTIAMEETITCRLTRLSPLLLKIPVQLFTSKDRLHTS